MNKKGIGFTNFRRFPKFPLLEFGPITYMVGRNNSGKSTMVKAFLLTLDYLKNNPWRMFAFDNSILEDANIVTFGRAKNKNLNHPVISFDVLIHNYSISIELSGKENDTKATVNSMTISDNINGYELTLDFIKDTSYIKKSNKNNPTYTDNNGSFIKKEISELKKQLKEIQSKTSKEALKITDKINKNEEKLKHIKDINESKEIYADRYQYDLEFPLEYQAIKQEEESSNDYLYEGDFWLDEEQEKNLYGIEKYSEEQVFHSELYKEDWGISDGRYNIKRFEDNTLKEVISTILYYNEINAKKLIENRRSDKEEDEIDNENAASTVALANDSYRLTDWIDNLVNQLNKEHYYYLAANPSKQSALFSIRDKSNSLAQAIHDFKQSGISKGDAEDLFVRKWMKEFEVGEDFEIAFVEGEAYSFNLISNGKTISLADKGMGSLQAMMLILRLSTLIRYHKETRKNINILVEEPELNLHPALQSKLSDLFHWLHKIYGFNFIIETHSEYMIRKSQVFTHNEEYGSSGSLNPNPFKTYYFPIDLQKPPYEMVYRLDGKFENEFMPGFFDVSSDLAFDIL